MTTCHGLADPRWSQLVADAAAAAGDPVAALELAGRAAEILPRSGEGRTLLLWRALGELAATDLTVARSLEPHLDAVSILAQAAGQGYAAPEPVGTWGVYAAEGPGTRLTARPHPADPDRVVLQGVKPWCSLAADVERALVTAWIDDRHRALVAVDLRSSGVELLDEPWQARGLARVRSTGLAFTEVPGQQVGPPGWYLSRPGFAWGGLGVAAVWLGGAWGLARRMLQLGTEREPDQIALMLLGESDARLSAASAVLDAAAGDVDAGRLQGEHAWPRTVRVRHVVHDACEAVLRLAAHALGPAPLTGEAGHAARVADLEVYLRQHKAERDAALIGRALLDGMPASWR